MAKTIDEKICIERNRQLGCIIFFLEGGFYRAYEHSALDAIKNLHEFKVNCRFYKALNNRVVSIGFPVTSLVKFARGNKVEQHDDIATIILPSGAIRTSKEEFTAWKESLPTTEDLNGPVPSEKQRNELYHKIIKFPIESRSPLQCMLFLAELKNELQYLPNKIDKSNGNL